MPVSFDLANLNASLPHAQPSAQECADMTWRAKEVVRLLEALRRMSGEQSTAEKDMEIIRTKRATSTAGGNASSGQPKSKYRKRSRATPPGKCHSCNIRETPEWRRGPDGARTLCNACGLHYAKLMRKREKQHGNNPDAPRIDMETLRASARAADADKQASRSEKRNSQGEGDSGDTSKPQNPNSTGSGNGGHQGSFQVMQVSTSNELGGRMQGDHVSSAHQQQSSLPTPATASNNHPPPPPWETSSSASAPARAYPLQDITHQSFLRSTEHANGSPR
ncbi:hypothetical protein ONZ45_g10896 [Pleurotus djamor]|nr:hypothetical protein ONZ45_g10896 [Pleurotus djamor]